MSTKLAEKPSPAHLGPWIGRIDDRHGRDHRLGYGAVIIGRRKVLMAMELNR